MATAKEALQSLRVLFEAKLSLEDLREFDSIAEPLVEHLKLVPDLKSYLRAQSAAFEEGAEALEGELAVVDYHPQSTGIWNPYEHQLSQLEATKD